MTDYEILLMLDPDLADERQEEIVKRIRDLVEAGGGTWGGQDVWGRRKLAYEIGRHKEGIYVLEVIFGGGELMKEIDRRFKVTELIIRHLAVRVDEEQEVVERLRAERTEVSRRRRVARGLPPDRQPGEGQRESDDDRDDRFDMGGEEMR